ncbi:MAG TPA: metallopeptidase TldD-related protein [bacterium]|nr:metallopeptidase TldD-related protein [bacterium]HPQ18056.1 metallopeptidase TldD-related protein [bacterium]
MEKEKLFVIGDYLSKKLKNNKFNSNIVNSFSRTISFENDKLKCFETTQANSASLRLFKNGKVGYSLITGFNNIDNLIQIALFNSKFGEKINIELPKYEKEINIKEYYHSLDNINWDELIKEANKIIKEIKKIDKEYLVNIDFIADTTETLSINSNNLNIFERSSSFSFSLNILKIQNTSIINISDYYVYPYFKNELHKIKENVIKNMELYKREEKIKEGKYNVVFTPDAVGSLIGSILIGINGKNVEKKISPLIDKINKQIVSEKITLIEKPDLDDCIGSSMLDDDGVLTSEKYLIKNGVLKQFIFDLITAKKMRTKSTGNGFGSPKVSPSFSNILILPSNISIEEIRKELKNYVLVDSFIGAGQSNILAGDFSAIIESGFYFKNNKYQFRIKDNMIAFNVYDVLKNKLVEISKETKNFGSKIFPYIVLKDINIV